MAVTEKLLALMDSIPMGGKQIHDANIVASMQAYNIPVLLTYNTLDFERYRALVTTRSIDEILKMSGSQSST